MSLVPHQIRDIERVAGASCRLIAQVPLRVLSLEVQAVASTEIARQLRPRICLRGIIR